MDSFFDALASTLFRTARAESVLRRTNVAIGAINELDVRSCLKNLKAAASVLKKFVVRVSRFLLVTSIRNPSNIVCCTALYTTDRIPPLVSWYDVRRVSSNDSSTSIASSSATSCFTVALTSSPTHLSSGRLWKSLHRLSVTSSTCPLGIIPGANAASLLRTAFHDSWGMSLCVSSTAVYKDSSFVGRCYAASRLFNDFGVLQTGRPVRLDIGMAEIRLNVLLQANL